MILSNPKAILLIIGFLWSFYNNAQVVWNENSFSLTRDLAELENMNGAIPIPYTYNGKFYSSGAIAPAGFSFSYGFETYNSFYVSQNGFLKLGSPITNFNPALDTGIIAPFFSGAQWWDATYKVVGTGLERKYIIQFSGILQPIGVPASFQVWLYPSGKIQFVYEQMYIFNDWQGWYNYNIFCQANIMGNKVIASVKIKPNNNLPVANYSDQFIDRNTDHILKNTRLTFQPDTAKPAKPTGLTFPNIYPGCFTINMEDSANNESLVVLERSHDGAHYKKEKYFYTNTPIGNSPYAYQQVNTQPLTNYYYRMYLSNGSKNSDTIYASLQTPMPQLNGIKKIPGDYPTITALLQDAACKHMGPNLLIELQNNYSFAAEKLPLYFKKELQNRFIQNITIQPAAGTSITMAGFTTHSLIYIDSVKHIAFDGRAGGTGTDRDLTMFQQNSNAATIQYANGADSGIINYCNIIKKNSYNSPTGAIVVSTYDTNYISLKRNVEALHITNNFVSADTNTISKLITIKSDHPDQAVNLLIEGNYFSRFHHHAIYLDGIGEGASIANNHFFQPDPVVPDKNGSCIYANNTGMIKIDQNFFGGNSEKWGHGKFALSGSGNFAFIHYQNVSDSSKAFITNNKFGNIAGAYSYDGSPHLLKISKGDVLIEGNTFGTTDSTNSITYGGFMWPLRINYGTKTIRNNFFSGFQADYNSKVGSNLSYIITTTDTDSLSISNNDIGGSDNILTNTASNNISIIDIGTVSGKVKISNNKLRGFSSAFNNITAISAGTGITNLETKSLVIENNSIHHLQSGGKVQAIACLVNFAGATDILNNRIYALKTTGNVSDGNIYGITYTNYNYGASPNDYKGAVNIFGNRIHSFESVRRKPASIFSFDAINVECPITRIFNNEIRLGINSKGLPVDSLTGITGISISPSLYASFYNHRHFIEHNSFYTGGNNMGGQFIKSFYSFQKIPDSNLVTITNNIFNMEALNNNINPVTVPFMQLAGTTPKTANNLWYSAKISSLPSLLASFQQSCNCSLSDKIGNPEYLNPTGDSSNYSLRPGTGGKADAAGAISVLGINRDIDGLKRIGYTAIDIGCYAVTATVNYPIFWSGAVSDAWENPLNWVGGKLPDINTDVMIEAGLPHYPVVNSNAECRSLSVKPGVTFKIMPGYTLNIEH